ncbi:hypothetical protein V8C86DRAFT_2884595 [Haematococcus lacustris]
MPLDHWLFDGSSQALTGLLPRLRIPGSTSNEPARITGTGEGTAARRDPGDGRLATALANGSCEAVCARQVRTCSTSTALQDDQHSLHSWGTACVSRLCSEASFAAILEPNCLEIPAAQLLNGDNKDPELKLGPVYSAHTLLPPIVTSLSSNAPFVLPPGRSNPSSTLPPAALPWAHHSSSRSAGQLAVVLPEQSSSRPSDPPIPDPALRLVAATPPAPGKHHLPPAPTGAKCITHLKHTRPQCLPATQQRCTWAKLQLRPYTT